MEEFNVSLPIRIKLPGAKRAHTFYAKEIDGRKLYLDWTDLQKKKSMDSALVYRMENGGLVFDRYIRVSIARREW